MSNLGKTYKRYTGVRETHDGHTLSIRESKFIANYIENGGDRKQAALKAGWSEKYSSTAGKKLMERDYIVSEIDYRMSQIEAESIATATEVMQYLTGVMRGDVKDQFGLDTSISDRTSAAKELVRRLDMQENQGKEQTTEIKLVVERRKSESD